MTSQRGDRATAVERHRQLQALELCVAGEDYDTIAERLEYADRSGAWRAVQTVLSRRESAAAEQLRKLEDLRLGASHQRLCEELAALPVGRDPLSAARLVTALVRVSESRRRLHGLDVPSTVEVKTRVHANLEDLKREFTQYLRRVTDGQDNGGDLAEDNR